MKGDDTRLIADDTVGNVVLATDNMHGWTG